MIILVGIAGAGKGTQGKLLVERFDLQYVSTGEMLRQYATEDQRQRMHSGELLSDDEIIEMVAAVIDASDHPEKILFDGFPRTITQAEWLIEQIKSRSLPMPHVFQLIVSRHAVKQRLQSRARADDHEDAIEERFSEYEKATLPLVQWLKSSGVSVHEVNGERSVEDIQNDLIQITQEVQ